MDFLKPSCSTAGRSGRNSAPSSSCLPSTSQAMGGANKPQKKITPNPPAQKISRSRSFMQLISRTFGRHFQNQHRKNDVVYSSQDDMQSSSSSGSYSVTAEPPANSNLNATYSNSAYDLTHAERQLHSLPYRQCSPAGCSNNMSRYNCRSHNQMYIDAIYRPTSAYGDRNHHPLSSDDEDDDIKQLRVPHTVANTPRHSSSNMQSAAKNKAQPASHASIRTFSVTRLVHHFMSSTSSSARSLSCNNSPVRQQKFQKTKHTQTKWFSSSSSGSTSGNSSCSGGDNQQKGQQKQRKVRREKKDKKQQSILRPPMQFVYTKGISGLYSRVPSYAACCPHAVHPLY